MVLNVFGEEVNTKGDTIQQNLPKNYSKSTKIAIIVWAICFRKFSGGSMLQDLLEPLYVPHFASNKLKLQVVAAHRK